MSGPLSFDLPMPPSVNKLFTNVAGIGRVKTRAYKSWINEAGWMLVTQRNQHGRHKRLDGPVSVTVSAYRGGKSRDLDNILKALLDLLKHTQTIKDDSQVVEIHARWVDFGVPCTLTVEEIAGEMAA